MLQQLGATTYQTLVTDKSPTAQLSRLVGQARNSSSVLNCPTGYWTHTLTLKPIHPTDDIIPI